MNFTKTLLSLAVSASTGFVESAHADIVAGTWTGAEAFVSINRLLKPNSDTNACLTPTQAPGYTGGCNRSAIAGTLAFDTDTLTGTATMDPFSWFGGGNNVFSAISFGAIGNGAGGPGTLLLGNLLFDWNGTSSIPVSVVWDAAGLFDAMSAGLSEGEVVTGGATPASENGDGAFPDGAVLATTTWNTTTIGDGALGVNPSGTLPLIADSVGGSPMTSGPWRYSNMVFDITEFSVSACTDTGAGIDACAAAVPVPATIWLFGSGIAGLAALARRRPKEGVRHQ